MIVLIDVKKKDKIKYLGASLGSQSVKNPPAMQETWVQSLGSEDPLKEEMAIHSSIVAWSPHGQRSLAGYSSWDHKELYMTEQLTKHSTAQGKRDLEEGIQVWLL